MVGVHLGERVESVVECDDVVGLGSGREDSFVEFHERCTAAALGAQTGTGMVDQDTPHELRAHGEEVSTVLPAGAILLDQANISLMNEFGAFETTVLLFVAEAAVRNAAEFGIDDWGELLPGRGIAFAPAMQEDRDFT